MQGTIPGLICMIPLVLTLSLQSLCSTPQLMGHIRHIGLFEMLCGDP